MKHPCAADVTDRFTGKRRGCSFSAMLGSDYCLVHDRQADRIEAARRRRGFVSPSERSARLRSLVPFGTLGSQRQPTNRG
jgi:hypothetical protein